MTVHFERKVGKVDWEKRILYRAAEGRHGGWTEEGKEEGWDLLVGADGNWSVVRGEMMRAQPYVASRSSYQAGRLLADCAHAPQDDIHAEADPARLDRAPPPAGPCRPCDRRGDLFHQPRAPAHLASPRVHAHRAAQQGATAISVLRCKDADLSNVCRTNLSP